MPSISSRSALDCLCSMPPSGLSACLFAAAALRVSGCVASFVCSGAYALK
jgi:hypothetical protein